MKPHSAYFVTSCIDSTAELITALVESGTPITRRTFLRYVDAHDQIAQEQALGYDTGTQRGGLRMSRDWHVGYFKGLYADLPCVYFVHSAIEYIFQPVTECPYCSHQLTPPWEINTAGALPENYCTSCDRQVSLEEIRGEVPPQGGDDDEDDTDEDDD